uniref:C-type lectin domain-containing protein n=2 Tax=Dicentrarchus labrax TaxID=13489 RepID=A0A8P4JVY1_DICLA
SGWTGYKGSCFHYIPTAMTWARAEKNCQSMGANLASVHSAEEYHELQRMIVSITHAYRETWIGGSDAQEEGVWLWSDGSSFNYRHCGGFDNWGGKQHCLQMNYGGQKCWDDCQCSYKRPFVCAKKI